MHDLAAILANWSLPWPRRAPPVRPDRPIPGSPERCLSRRVVADEAENLYVLETIAPDRLAGRERMAALTAALADAGLRVACAYLPCRHGGFTARIDDTAHQLCRYAAGDPPPRPEYASRPGHGRALGIFLAELRQAASTAVLPPGLTDFSLAPYAERLARDMARHAPAALTRLRPILDNLADFLAAEPAMPRALCHGDVHPLNVVWSGEHIVGVIDWEFAGYKHELYDAANALGCVGIEDPASFKHGAAAALLATLRETGLVTEANARWLRPAVMAGRLGWLAEWLRRDDREMIALEMDYLDLINAKGPADPPRRGPFVATDRL